MKDNLASLLRSKNNSLQKLTGLILLLVLNLPACLPAADNTSSAQTQPYTFYLDTRTENNLEHKLIPLDPQTLDEQPDGKTFETGIQIISADGSTGIDVEYPMGRAGQNPEDRWIVVYDLQNGNEQNRFHSPARGLVSGLSKDGTRLLLQADADPYTLSPYPPTIDWSVVVTADGELLTHIKDADNACFRQRAFLDPDGQRIYCMVDPALIETDEPVPLRVAAYDIESGQKAGELELPEVFIGSLMSEQNGQAVEEFFEPALALSPDGRQLAVVHTNADMITLINAHDLTIEKTFSLNRSTNLEDWFGFAPATAYAKGNMQGIIHHAVFNTDGEYLYVFTQEVWLKQEDKPARRGIRLVDLDQGQIVAKALPDYQIQWVQPAPDGTLYVFGTTDERLLPYEIRDTSPSILWRLDAFTLEILAERAFAGYRHGYLVIGAVAATSLTPEPTSIDL